MKNKNKKLNIMSNLFILTVPEHIPMGLLAVILGFFFSNPLFIRFDLVFGLISAVFIIGGYNSFNAVFDIEVDKINKPHRPIPKGVISTTDALIASFIFFVAALLFGYLVNIYFLYIVIFMEILAICYSIPRINLKRRFILGTISASLFYTILMPLLGWSINYLAPPPIILIIYLFLVGTALSVLKDFEDIIGDSMHNVKTLPLHLGYSKTLVFSSALIAISALFLELTIFLHRFSSIYIPIPLITIFGLIVMNSIRKNRSYNYWRYNAQRGMFVLIGVEVVLLILKIMSV